MLQVVGIKPELSKDFEKFGLLLHKIVGPVQLTGSCIQYHAVTEIAYRDTNILSLGRGLQG
jgi:hypothetical protein